MADELLIKNEAEMLAFGKKLADICRPGNRFYLHGELGAGKTTLTRGFMRGFGHEGAVKSPTYTIVEQYILRQQTIFHFDLYRLTDPEELEHMGARDYFHQTSICLVEWSDNGAGFLPTADLNINICYEASTHRRLRLSSETDEGLRLLQAL